MSHIRRRRRTWRINSTCESHGVCEDAPSRCLGSVSCPKITHYTAHSELDYCNFLHSSLSNSLINRLQPTQNSVARDVIYAFKFIPVTHIFKFVNGLKSVNVINIRFLSRVSILTRDIDIENLSVCLSVSPSVHPSFTFRYHMKTA